MPVMGTVKFQRFFRAAAGLQVDRNDLRQGNIFLGIEDPHPSRIGGLARIKKLHRPFLYWSRR